MKRLLLVLFLAGCGDDGSSDSCSTGDVLVRNERSDLTMVVLWDGESNTGAESQRVYPDSTKRYTLTVGSHDLAYGTIGGLGPCGGDFGGEFSLLVTVGCGERTVLCQ